MHIALTVLTLISVAASWLYWRRFLSARDDAARVRSTLTERDQELARLRVSEEAERTLRREREANHAAMRNQQDEAHREQLEELRKATDEKVALVTANRGDFVKEMEAISAKALAGATAQVTKLADEARKVERQSAAGDAQLRAEELKRVVAPISEHLGKVQSQVEHLQRERRATDGAVRELVASATREVDKLRLETSTLASALKRPQVRGAWGEMQLRNVVKAAGMTEHVDFHEQKTLDAGDDGRVRPDMTVHLPTERDIVVDSKVPLDAYLAAIEATNDEERERHLDRHAGQIRTHLDALGAKAYQSKLERSADFVVCFLPNEACYVAALDRDPTLLQHGADKHVLIATPTTLLALLHATYYGWRQAAIEETAEQVAAAAKELYRRCATFAEHFVAVGKRLNSVTTAYNGAVGSFESRIVPQLRKFEVLEAASSKTVELPVAVDTVARGMAVAELPSPLETELQDLAGDAGIDDAALHVTRE